MWGTNNILVLLGILVAELVLVVQISERIVLQKCTGYLGKKFVWIFRGFGYCRYDWVFLGGCR